MYRKVVAVYSDIIRFLEEFTIMDDTTRCTADIPTDVVSIKQLRSSFGGRQNKLIGCSFVVSNSLQRNFDIWVKVTVLFHGIIYWNEICPTSRIYNSTTFGIYDCVEIRIIWKHIRKLIHRWTFIFNKRRVNGFVILHSNNIALNGCVPVGFQSSRKNTASGWLVTKINKKTCSYRGVCVTKIWRFIGPSSMNLRS